MPKRKNIFPQMFDVKPVNPDGSLDLGRIRKLRRTVALPEKTIRENETFEARSPRKGSNLRLADVVRPKNISESRNAINHFSTKQKAAVIHGSRLNPDRDTFNASLQSNAAKFQPQPELFEKYFNVPNESYQPEIKPDENFFPRIETFSEKLSLMESAEPAKPEKKPSIFSLKKRVRPSKRVLMQIFSDFVPRLSYAFSFAAILLLFCLSIPALSYVQRALDMKTALTANAKKALGQFAEAKDNLSNSRFEKASVDFSESYQILSNASRDIGQMGGNFSEILRFVPGMSKVASANYVISAGEHFSLAGKSLADSAKSLNSLGNPLDSANQSNQPSLTDLFLNLRDGIQKSSVELSQAQDDLNKVNIDDLPSETRNQFSQLKAGLPAINASLKNFLDYSQIFLDVLGYNGPRKYLFLFENNQEMRATGGFIGSYGILDISSGRLKKLFVDDIYNPDGQLKARVIPPSPIQKMSAVWTMHDANWFPDFPTSAEKVAWFYEKTGGPTVDGVIAVTPELLEDLLKVTGPIDMPEYGKTVDAGNFTEVTQQEVEMDFDKELNQPKKFVADLTPKILDKVMGERGIDSVLKTLKAFNMALAQKHLLLYSRNYNIQKLISDQKWSGEILNTDKDYLSVINTNIDGYKTDGVIDETIDHHSNIQEDGSIIDTVSVTRNHNGGNEKYDWWNKVNGDWMRVYVPKDAKLLSADGQTRETVPAALDYKSLGFKRDPQVQTEEDSTRIDDQSGTQIFDENNKTVFANWVYVSPGESVTLTYKYILPFKLSFDALQHPADSFSVLYQKQSGSVGSKLVSEVSLPNNLRTIWRWPDGLKQSGNSYKMEAVLDTDRFVGMAVEK
ncbi:MAG TPA: DUF4012 domain-containing protein [Candidatus Bathyarchaeia archaeon]|nr:DUF4012 domain-containing protein [Candidatus Bathyarchaeia archaeon]